MSEEKREEEIAPGVTPEERPDLQDYKSSDKQSSTGKKLILLRLLQFQHQKEMCKQKQN